MQLVPLYSTGIIVSLPFLAAISALSSEQFSSTPGLILLAIAAFFAYVAYNNHANLTLCAELFQLAAEAGLCKYKLNPVAA